KSNVMIRTPCEVRVMTGSLNAESSVTLGRTGKGGNNRGSHATEEATPRGTRGMKADGAGRHLSGWRPAPSAFLFDVRAAHSPVPPFQSLVRNGDAGRPSLLHRFGLAVLRQPKRTCVGFSTSFDVTMTFSPSIVALAV